MQSYTTCKGSDSHCLQILSLEQECHISISTGSDTNKHKCPYYIPEVSADDDAKYPCDTTSALLTSVLTADDDTNVGRSDVSC